MRYTATHTKKLRTQKTWKMHVVFDKTL